MNEDRLGTYDELAEEYYDSSSHPTCANFRELSELFFRLEFVAFLNDKIRILEVGAGLSILAPIISSAGFSLKHLLLLDKSEKMLAYSKRWIERGARSIVGDACDTGLVSNDFDIVAGSLVDPYNCPKFWREVYRLLAPGGHALVTIPASEWSEQFRVEEIKDKAEFELRTGERLLVSSLVPSTDDQIKMIEDADLAVDRVISYSFENLSGPVSPKLLAADRKRVLCGFIAHRT